MSNKVIHFDKNFMFGACTSAEQSEGNRKDFKTNWDLFYKSFPNHFFNKVGPKNTSQVFKKYKEDIALYNEIGLDSFRTSISWARLFPKKGEISRAGINFYHRYIDELIDKDIKVMICLNHFDLPDWVVKMGGFENPAVADEFLKYAELVLEEFGTKIDYLITFNEPVVPIYCGYLGKDHWPRVNDGLSAVRAAYGTILCHTKVVNLFNLVYRGKIKTKIGVIVNISPALIKDGKNYTKMDEQAAKLFDLIHNYALLDAMCKGTFSPDLISMLKKENLMIQVKEEDLAMIRKNHLDFLGINYYSPYRVQARDKSEWASYPNNFLERYTQQYTWPEARINPFRGWEILPEMFDKIAELIKNRYDNIPFYISENGMGVQGEERFRNEDGMINDQYRISFIKEHLIALQKAIKKHGVNCFGYHLWASIDCWSWLNAYKNRYGLIEVNIENGKRDMKASAYWYKKLIIERAFQTKFDPIENFMDISVSAQQKIKPIEHKVPEQNFKKAKPLAYKAKKKTSKK